ncbi:Listeria-Bacteroides repeat domain [Bacteroidales bacterium Barb6XT]|nr:Listeria-Bacteroides repeat domain [Bacteroidales bacterium Barb6XT]
MKRTVFLAVLCLACVFQAMEARIIGEKVSFGHYYYNFYDDLTAAVVGPTHSSTTRASRTIPATLSPKNNPKKEYNGKTFNVTAISAWAFDGDKWFKTFMNFSEGLLRIENDAFFLSDMGGLITIPKSVTSIGRDAFWGCGSLESVTFKGGKLSIEDAAFASCHKLHFLAIEEGEISIGAKAFLFCDKLGYAQIGRNPESDKISIGAEAFNGCKQLSTVYPHGVTGIGTSAFKGCEKLDDIFIPGIMKDWGEAIFEGCKSLKSITVNEGVTSIGYGAFRNTPALEKIQLPNSLTSIEAYAFAYCPSLTSVAIPDSVTRIGANAFAGCSSLTSVAIPRGVTRIGAKAFAGCSSLTSVTIPDSVTVLGDSAFADCTNLRDIYLEWDDPNRLTVGKLLFEKVPANGRVHIPKGSEEKYGWESDVASAKWQGVPIVANYYSVAADVNDLAMGNVTDGGINGEMAYGTKLTLTASPAEGYHFSKWTNEWGDSLSTGNTYTFSVKGNMTVRAHFARNYRVSLSAENGTIRSGEGIYLPGEEIKAEAAARNSSIYHFVKWTNERGDSLSAANPWLFTATGDTTLKAHFALNSYTVNLSAVNGAIQSGNGTYTYGDTVTATAGKGREEYHFAKWTNERGDSLSAANPWLFTATGDVTLQAHFALNSYTVTLPDKKGTYMYGEAITVTTAVSNTLVYHFEKWTNEKGEFLSYDNPYTFVVTGDVVVQAYIALNRHTVELSATNGMIKSGGGTYTHGTEATVEAAAADTSAYHFVKWTNEGGDSLSADNPYTFTVTRGTSLQAHFAGDNPDVNYWPVRLSAVNGTIKSGDGTYAQGAEARVEAAAANTLAYHFVKWTDRRGDNLSTANPYTFIVTGETALTAWFDADSCRVSLSAGDNGMITSGRGVYLRGTEVKIGARADNGYHFLKWVNAAGEGIDGNPYTFVVTKDTEMTAIFAKDSLTEPLLVEPLTGFETLLGVYYAKGVLHLVNLDGYFISVRTLDGRQVLQFTADGDNAEQAAALPAGVYILNGAKWKERYYVTKFVVR